MTRLEQALAAIDAANANDPNTLEVSGVLRPKELAHADLASDWIGRLCPDASEALRIAARAHHIRRWERPRAGFPIGRAGYLRWRSALQVFHSSATEVILREVGYDEETIARVATIVQKRGLGRDPEVQTFEDALALTFIETQLAAFAEQHASDKSRAVLEKTLKKMSVAARVRARSLPLPKALGALLRELIDQGDVDSED